MGMDACKGPSLSMADSKPNAKIHYLWRLGDVLGRAGGLQGRLMDEVCEAGDLPWLIDHRWGAQCPNLPKSHMKSKLSFSDAVQARTKNCKKNKQKKQTNPKGKIGRVDQRPNITK